MPNENENQNLVAITPPANNTDQFPLIQSEVERHGAEGVSQQPQADPVADQPKTYVQQFNAWYFDSKADEVMGIETCRYDTGGISKRCKLSDGRMAVCHRLKSKDRLTVKRAAGNDKDKYEDALIAVCTKIDEKGIVLEDLDNLWFNDAMTLQTMAQDLNFT